MREARSQTMLMVYYINLKIVEKSNVHPLVRVVKRRDVVRTHQEPLTPANMKLKGNILGNM